MGPISPIIACHLISQVEKKNIPNNIQIKFPNYSEDMDHNGLFPFGCGTTSKLRQLHIQSQQVSKLKLQLHNGTQILHHVKFSYQNQYQFTVNAFQTSNTEVVGTNHSGAVGSHIQVFLTAVMNWHSPHQIITAHYLMGLNRTQQSTYF